MHRNTHSALAGALLLAAAFIAAPALGQITYSIDFQGPTVGAGLVTDGDILMPTPPVGPPPAPTVAIPGGAAGLGIAPSPFGNIELDALSYGTDRPIIPDELPRWLFSVDEFAIGEPAPAPAPSVTTEGALGLGEASADVYFQVPPAPGPIVPPGGPVGVFNFGFRDGNGGLTPFPSPTLNLVEPNPPTPAGIAGIPSLPDPGDNLDALDVDNGRAVPVYFSLDGNFPDPLEAAAGVPPNTATAGANGFLASDILVSPGGGGPPVLYAPTPLLGLAPAGINQDQDDVDALVLWENGTPGYQPTTGPYSWIGGPAGAGTDMLLYSVRRGSFAIGMPDAIFGAPIEEGDVLIPVMTPAGAFVPGIFIPAEELGLATVRGGTAASYGIVNPTYGADVWADDLDALDVVPEPSAALLILCAVGVFATRRRK